MCNSSRTTSFLQLPHVIWRHSPLQFFISLFRRLLSRKRDECDLLSLDLSELVCWSVLYLIVQTIVIKKKRSMWLIFPWSLWAALLVRSLCHCSDHGYLEKEMNVTYFPLISVSWSADPSSSGQRWSCERQSEQCRPHIIPVLCCGM